MLAAVRIPSAPRDMPRLCRITGKRLLTRLASVPSTSIAPPRRESCPQRPFTFGGSDGSGGFVEGVDVVLLVDMCHLFRAEDREVLLDGVVHR
ncbi:hypothetical protein Pta02_05790 [Planobispora takensis]|uniref:Uncharacterized protein n=1 Tax=Planobispora takensis TaxID=1367882 RepID=A0A8J3WQY4_9ACTN|nr:hypothetical protein Pta02_05790 [Planobispora takensis]